MPFPFGLIGIAAAAAVAASISTIIKKRNEKVNCNEGDSTEETCREGRK